MIDNWVFLCQTLCLMLDTFLYLVFDVLFAMKFIFWCFWIYVIWDHFKVEQPSDLAQWILSHVKNHKLHIKVQTANRLARSCKNLVATVYAKAKVYALHLKPLNLAFVILSFFSLHLLSYLKPFSPRHIIILLTKIFLSTNTS